MVHACGGAGPRQRHVRAPSRSIPPPWGSIRLRQAHHTYAPRGCIVRVVPGRLTKPRKTPTGNILRLVVVIRYNLVLMYSNADGVERDEVSTMAANRFAATHFSVLPQNTMYKGGTLPRWREYHDDYYRQTDLPLPISLCYPKTPCKKGYSTTDGANISLSANWACSLLRCLGAGVAVVLACGADGAPGRAVQPGHHVHQGAGRAAGLQLGHPRVRQGGTPGARAGAVQPRRHVPEGPGKKR